MHCYVDETARYPVLFTNMVLPQMQHTVSFYSHLDASLVRALQVASVCDLVAC